MGADQPLRITLPPEMAAKVRARVASGLYATESEVVLEALRALDDHEMTVEDWLRSDVVTAYDALKADPARARPLQEARAAFAHARTKADE